jgi:Tetratricopeptide repeat
MVLALSGSKRLTLDQLHPAEARELLCSIASHLTADVADQIADLCGYLPLALRAAGSLLAVTVDLEPADYVEQLREECTRLEKIGSEEIERSVAATFHLSYVRLSDEAARVFRTLSVMQGSFDASAAEAIAEDERHAQLSELVKRSLVQYDSPTKRYRMHDLTRLFAAARLNDEERLTAARQHAMHYQTVLSAADDLYQQGHDGVLEGLAWYEQEASQIAAGQAWAVARMGAEEGAAQLCIAYPDAGVYVLELRQHPRERIQWLEAMLAAARQLQQREAEGAALGNLGGAYAALGEMPRAIGYYEQVLQIAREIGDRRGEGYTRWNMALAWEDLGDRAQAIAGAEAALFLFEQIEDPYAATVREALAEWR